MPVLLLDSVTLIWRVQTVVIVTGLMAAYTLFGLWLLSTPAIG